MNHITGDDARVHYLSTNLWDGPENIEMETTKSGLQEAMKTLKYSTLNVDDVNNLRVERAEGLNFE